MQDYLHSLKYKYQQSDCCHPQHVLSKTKKFLVSRVGVNSFANYIMHQLYSKIAYIIDNNQTLEELEAMVEKTTRSRDKKLLHGSISYIKI